MNLTKKVAVFILSIYALFLGLYFLLYHVIFSGPIKEQKNLFAHNIVNSTLTIFDGEFQRILVLIEDWASWDSMYNYVSDPKGPLGPEMSSRLKLTYTCLSFLMIVDKKKEIINLRGYHCCANRSLPFDTLSQKKTEVWDFLLKTYNEKGSKMGIVQSEYGPMLIVSSPILHNDNRGPQNGRVMIGRLFNRTLEERIKFAIGAETNFLFTESSQTVPGSWDQDFDRLKVEEIADKMIIEYPVKDVENHHVMTVQVAVKKHMFKIFNKTARLFFILMLSMFLLSGVVVYLLLNRLVVRRVKQMSTSTHTIISIDDLSQRIPETYHDEITLLSKNINEMLNRLQTENIRKEEVERTAVLNEKLIFLGRISTNITHEINNPLFAITNSISVIKKRLTPGDIVSNEAIQVMEREVNRAKGIARDMHKLIMPNLETSKPSDISTIIDAAIDVIKWSKQSKNTQIDYMKHGYSFPLLCNPEALQQVFMNIIQNSIEAMEGEGRVVIDVFEKDAEYRIDFIDNGPGFSDSIKAAMFKPYKSTKPEGSGLGLNISYHIVTNHGGTIILDDSYREGAHLIIKIPAKGGAS